jgi:predicted TIM-barrel fold metal-dependent hydrolase
MLDRRAFTKSLLASLAFGGAPGCTPSSSDYSDNDAARLVRQKADEAARSGTGPFGALRVEGYRGLSTLPYFELAPDGQLRTRIALPPVIDFHAHLGWAHLLAPQVDLTRRAPRTEYLLDCDRDDPPCSIDLDVYVNANFTAAMRRELTWETLRTLTVGGRKAATHTVPNLVEEMDRVGVGRAAILPIATGLPFDGDPTLHVLESIEQTKQGNRLIAFASVHPSDGQKRAKLRRYKERGVRGVKLHPEMQRFFPDAPEAMQVYEECGRLDLPVIFHAGRSGIEPEFMRPYALMRRYVPGIQAYPNVRFVLGHAGARDVADAIPIAQQHDNVWLELSSQGVTKIANLLQAVGASKLLFGTDWPFYPLAVSLAKVLIVTEGKASARRAILGENARRVLREA